MAKLVIEYIVEKKGINLNTLVDTDFSQLCWLNARESIRNEAGEKVSKSYFYKNEKEAIRITYHKLYGKHTYNTTDYSNVFLGVKKEMHWIDWAGNIGRTKHLQPYYFKLGPILDDTNNIIGFSSPKMREIMEAEKRSVKDKTEANNTLFYSAIN